MLRWGDRNKTKLVEECEAMFAQLHEMAKRGKQRRSAYRTSIYDDLADVAKKRLMLDQNAKLKRIALQSIAKSRGWPEARVTSRRFRLTSEVVAISMGARTRGRRQ